MRLDDRPVIDQLLDPTPLAHLREVEREISEQWLGGEQGNIEERILDTLSDEVKTLDLDLSAETLWRLNDALSAAAEYVAEWFTEVADDAVREALSRLEARL